jgi:hypothetical protein
MTSNFEKTLSIALDRLGFGKVHFSQFHISVPERQ